MSSMQTHLTPYIQIEGRAITPGKIVCIGRNYVEHIHELNNPIPEHMVLFIKPASAISTQLNSHHGRQQDPLHFETEICFLVQNGEIAGVGVGLDLTKRDVQSQLKQAGLPWERAKCFSGSALFSEFVALNSPQDPQQQNADPIKTLHLKLFIDGQLQQAGGVDLMLNSPQQILEEVEENFGLSDYDIIMTGTPKGVGVVNSGAKFVAQLFRQETLLTEVNWVAI